MLKTNGVLNTEDREEEIKQIEVYKSHSKFMKNKVRSINKITYCCLNNGNKSFNFTLFNTSSSLHVVFW